MSKVAVVGAGFSGAACARRLADAGLEPVVFEKSRGPGGRSSTRRRDGYSFDHGAQYFTARDPVFRRLVDDLGRDGWAERWTGRVVELKSGVVGVLNGIDRWVGVPGMSALPGRLLKGIEVRTGTRVESLVSRDGAWYLELAGGPVSGPFEAVILAVPAPQAAGLARATPLAEAAAAATMRPCWAGMFAFAEPIPVEYDAASVIGGRIGWMARNSSKPSRPREPDAWVVHATPEWSTAYLDMDGSDVAALLFEAFREETGVDVGAPIHAETHRWRYALADSGQARTRRSEGWNDASCLFDAGRGIGFCGDWLTGARIESAVLSGFALADRIIAEPDSRGTRDHRPVLSHGK